MATIDLDMDDMFEERESGADENQDLENSTQQNVDGLENDEEGELADEAVSKLKKIKGGAAKKKVLKPQPKLDATRLTGPRGIPILPDLFKDVKFKGPGNEVSDLRRLMGILENWAHRLFPKMPFDEVIERCEKLGAKNAVQTCIKKMRLDMPILNDDFVSQQADSDEDKDRDRDGDNVNDVQSSQVDEVNEELLDEIFRDQAAEHSVIIQNSATTDTTSENGLMTAEQRERMERNKQMAMRKRVAKHDSPHLAPGLGPVDQPSNTIRLNDDSFRDDDPVADPDLTAVSGPAASPTAGPAAGSTAHTASQLTLTDEQRQRIERNKQLAKERQLAKKTAVSPMSQPIEPVSPPGPGAQTVESASLSSQSLESAPPRSGSQGQGALEMCDEESSTDGDPVADFCPRHDLPHGGPVTDLCPRPDLPHGGPVANPHPDIAQEQRSVEDPPVEHSDSTISKLKDHRDIDMDVDEQLSSTGGATY